MPDPQFPPADGWCVEVTDRESGAVVDQRVFMLAEDAREFAKSHVWRAKDQRARVFNREGGETVFSTVIEFPRLGG